MKQVKVGPIVLTNTKIICHRLPEFEHNGFNFTEENNDVKSFIHDQYPKVTISARITSRKKKIILQTVQLLLNSLAKANSMLVLHFLNIYLKKLIGT